MGLGELTFETVKPLAGTTFEVALPDGRTTTLRLEDALAHPPAGRTPRGIRPATRVPFSMYFLGPPSEILPQGAYTMRSEHVTFGGLFIVPIGRDDEATEYQAVFT
jgi:hypothetical protein